MDKIYITITFKEWVVANKVVREHFDGEEKRYARFVRNEVAMNLDEYLLGIFPSDIKSARIKDFKWAVFASLDSLEPIYCSKKFPIAWYASVEAARLGLPEISPSRIGISAGEEFVKGLARGYSQMKIYIDEWNDRQNVKPEDLLRLRRSGKSLQAADIYDWLAGHEIELIEQPETVELTWKNHDKRSRIWKLSGTITANNGTLVEDQHITQFFTSLDDLHQYIYENKVGRFGIYRLRFDPETKNAIWDTLISEHLRCAGCGCVDIVTDHTKEPNHVTC